MFKNTIATLNDAKRKIKLGAKIFSISVQIIYLAYLAFCMLSGLGNIFVNVALAITATAYLIFDISTRDHTDKITKKTRKKVSTVYRRLKLLYGLFPLLASVYAMYSASAADVEPLAIITTTIMIILWVVRAIIELAVYLISKQIDALKAAFLADVENVKATITKPIDAVGDFVKGVAGRSDEVNASGAAQLGQKVKSFFTRKKTSEEDGEREFSFSGKK